MIRLVRPEQKYLSSYMEAYDEYIARGISPIPFSDARGTDVFRKFDDFRFERDLPARLVGADFFWLVDDERSRFLGEITVRHRLNETLERVGGHIGYGVRCSEWNRGYATLMLRLALDEARALGLTEVLITCADDNLASARVMEKNGAALQDRIEHNGRLTRRYRITL